MGIMLLFLGMWAGLIAFVAWLFMLLWNAVVPAVFNGPHLTYWLAFGLLMLVGFFKSSVIVNNRR